MGNQNSQNQNNVDNEPKNQENSEERSHSDVSEVPVQPAPAELVVQKEEEYVPMNTFVEHKKHFASKLKKSKLDQSKLVVSNPEVRKQFGLDSQIMLVPFSVILQRMDKDLHHTFINLGRDMFQDYLQKDEYDKQWKLHGNGFFINYQQGYFVCIITPHLIYKGAAATDKHNTIYPNVEGILISKEGMYQGGFKKGKAHGNGKYTNKITGITYSGEWENGSMTKGRIEGEQYKFRGQLQNGCAEGVGAIQFKKNQQTYTGNFHQGKYHDKEGKYATKNYVYSGGFVNGMKEGEGVLGQKPKGKIQKKSKYRPAEVFDGEWIEDYFVTTRAERESKRIRGEENRQMVEHMFEQVMFFADKKKEGSISEFQQLYNTTSKIDIQKRKSKGEEAGGGFMGAIKEINRQSGKRKQPQTLPTDPQIPEYVQQDPLEQDW